MNLTVGSPGFFAFVAAAVAGYHLLPRRAWKYGFLTLASWAFYAAASPGYLWVLLLLTAIDYLAALRIAAADAPAARKAWLALSVAANLGLLGAFKYAGFFADNAASLAGAAGVEVPPRAWDLILPLGISFHTFQGISYTVDVYRRKVAPVRSPLDYALFVAFFPQLAAGPIVRAVEFLPQMAAPPRVTAADVEAGLVLFVRGLFKKLFIADQLHLLFVGPVFLHPDQYAAGVLRWAAVAWAVQIYCDFSGYTDIALGVARWFGFSLPENFRLPFLATSIADFWRRWHLSLSTWLRDYLYFPLGGSRHGEARTAVNLMVLFVLCGLWHGAAWSWLAYGAFNGALMVGHRAWDRAVGPAAWRRSPAWVAAARALTAFQLVLGLVLIRMESWAGGWRVIAAVCGLPLDVHPGGAFDLVPPPVFPLLALGLAGHVGFFAQRFDLTAWRRPWLTEALRGGACAAAVLALVAFGPGATKSFIYIAF